MVIFFRNYIYTKWYFSKNFKVKIWSKYTPKTHQIAPF